jgi:hypothetical protein
MAERQREGVLAPIAGEEMPRLAGHQRGQMAHGIAFQRFDLDHVGAALGQHLSAEGDGDELTELDDLHTGKWLARHWGGSSVGSVGSGGAGPTAYI